MLIHSRQPPAAFRPIFLLFSFFVLGLLPPNAFAQAPAETTLAAQIEAVINQPGADRAFWGIEVYSPARGQTLYSLNAQRYFVPASVTKLFTTAAALDLVGPDYRFRTYVGTRGRVDESGRLLGDLHLVGGGDPDLAGCVLPYAPLPHRDELVCDPTPALDHLARQIAEKGVQVVLGDLIIDQTFFAPEPYSPDWELGDLLWSYGTPVRALSLADNTLVVRVEPGEKVGDPARILLEPFTRLYRIDNQVRTADAGSETVIHSRRPPGSRVLTLAGAITLGHGGRKLRVAVEEPSEFVGELFLSALERRSVRLQGELRVELAPAPPAPRTQANPLPVVLAERASQPLLEDVKFINKESRNLHAEMLLRVLGRMTPPESPLPERLRSAGEPPSRRGDGSAEAGLEVLRAWLANAGIDPEEVALHDGSGLARQNLVTPQAVVALLCYIETRPSAAAFRESLAIGAQDGTLAERLSSIGSRVRAKTGSLAHTNALAGYLETRAGETLLFALFANHHTLPNNRALELIDQLCAVLANLPRPRPGG